MTHSFINKIATAVPDHDVHTQFIHYVSNLLKDDRRSKVFERMAQRSGISHRYSFFEPGAAPDNLEKMNFYQTEHFPNTKQRMQFYQDKAFILAQKACDQLDIKKNRSISHIIITSCTGFYAPGIDFDIIQHYGLNPAAERSVIGFMGCSAAINGLKLAHHIVRSRPDAEVLVVNVELCTLHLQDTDNIEQLLSFLIFADGAAACIVSSKQQGIEIKSFHSTIIPDSHEQLTWQIGQSGFDMVLSGQVPLSVAAQLPNYLPAILQGAAVDEIDLWAVHPGGRSILDAVEQSIGLPKTALDDSRKILHDYGNMSSATIMFVLKEMMYKKGKGCAIAFGPGITAETMLFNA